eukprot:m.158789 g.158789  ORF g.158789 m.158789 type:complete len:101 (+) comp17981_c1_seq1:1290-1592(+)
MRTPIAMPASSPQLELHLVLAVGARTGNFVVTDCEGLSVGCVVGKDVVVCAVVAGDISGVVDASAASCTCRLFPSKHIAKGIHEGRCCCTQHLLRDIMNI